MSYSGRMQQNHSYSVFFAPRGRDRMYDLGMQIAQLYLSPFDKLIGIFVSVSAAGFAVGAPFGNLCYDVFGDYKPAFITFALLIAAVAVALQFVLKAAHRDKKRILDALSETQQPT